MFRSSINKMKLSDVKDGSLVEILEYRFPNEVEKMLKELGLLPNSTIRVVKNFGGATVVEIHFSNGSLSSNAQSSWKTILSSLLAKRIYVVETTKNHT